jgi:hypothetical protein
MYIFHLIAGLINETSDDVVMDDEKRRKEAGSQDA